jgi:hypothetical protein
MDLKEMEAALAAAQDQLAKVCAGETISLRY